LLSAIIATLFLGGWHGPFVEQAPVLGVFYFFAKTSLVLFALMWVRATYPRLRIDQMMAFCWKVLVPVALVVMFLAALVVKLPINPSLQALLLSASNIVALLVVLGIIGGTLRREVQRRRSALSANPSSV
jgi:NADH-quinone oxidoreductase subunit H